MPQIKVVKPFKFAHDGYRVEEFEPAEDPIEVTEACAEVALAEGWAEEPKAAKAKASKAAPENKGE